MEVEILKIGSIVPKAPISGSGTYDTSQFKSETIMIVSNGGKLFDYYISILKENCDKNYSFLKTDKSIVGNHNIFRSSLLGNVGTEHLKGISDGDPQVGKSYTINNLSWGTSKVIKVIDDVILITKNSVYAIHNTSKLRERKLKDLGI